MTKEAKIGMLTGLGVIVLIGIMLSNYLGAAPGAAPGGLATGRMAELPMGAARRDQMLQEVGVPAMAQGDPAAVATSGGMTGIPAAFAVDTRRDMPLAAPLPTGPVMRAPVAAVPAGQIVTAPPPDQGLPATVQIVDVGSPLQSVPASLVPTPTARPTDRPTVGPTAGEQYVIAKGDGLRKIAAHFYKSDTAENRQRIIAANPGIMKDGQPFLIAGKTLIIPGVTAAAPVAPRNAAQPVALKLDPRKPAGPGVVIGLPGSGKTSDKVAGKAPTPPAKAPDAVADAKVYVVKDGDTLTKIAKKIDAAHYPTIMKKIVAANGITDPKTIQPGSTLKLPL